MDFNELAAELRQQQHHLAARATVVYMDYANVIDPVVDGAKKVLPYVSLAAKAFESAEYNHLDVPEVLEPLNRVIAAIDETGLPEAVEKYEDGAQTAEYAVERDEWVDSTNLSPDMSGPQLEKDIAEQEAREEAHADQLADKQKEHEQALVDHDKAIENQAEKLARAYDGDAQEGFLKQLTEAGADARTDLINQHQTELKEMTAQHEAELAQVARDQHAEMEFRREAEVVTRVAPTPTPPPLAL